MFQNLIKLVPTAQNRNGAEAQMPGRSSTKKTIWTKCFVREEKKIETGCGCCLGGWRGDEGRNQTLIATPPSP